MGEDAQVQLNQLPWGVRPVNRFEKAQCAAARKQCLLNYLLSNVRCIMHIRAQKTTKEHMSTLFEMSFTYDTFDRTVKELMPIFNEISPDLYPKPVDSKHWWPYCHAHSMLVVYRSNLPHDSAGYHPQSGCDALHH